jgi:hypothetical protein
VAATGSGCLWPGRRDGDGITSGGPARPEAVYGLCCERQARGDVGLLWSISACRIAVVRALRLGAWTVTGSHAHMAQAVKVRW